MGTRTKVKVGDTLPVVLRTIRLGESVLDFSDPKWQVLARATDPAGASGPEVQYTGRDITAIQAASGNPGQGVAALPIWSGRGLPGVSTGVVAVAAGQIVTVTLAVGADAGIDRQALYMTKAGASSPFYLVAEGPNGFAAAGFPVGDPTYSPAASEEVVGLDAGTPAADAVLVQAAPTADESRTNGELVKLTQPVISSAVAGGSGGTIDAGNHEFVAIGRRQTDGPFARELHFEFRFVDTTTGDPSTWPPDDDPEVLEFVDRV